MTILAMCNSGMSVIGKTNNFLISVKTGSTRENLGLVPINMTKNTWLERLQTLRVKIQISFCLMNMISNSLLNIYLYTHRLIHLSLLFGKASLLYGCPLVQKVTTGHRRKMLNLKLVVYKSLPLRLGTSLKRKWEDSKGQSLGRSTKGEKSVSWVWPSIALMKSLRLWLPAANLHVIGPSNIPSWKGEEIMRLTLPWGITDLILAKGRSITFFNGVATGKWAVPINNHSPRFM